MIRHFPWRSLRRLRSARDRLGSPFAVSFGGKFVLARDKVAIFRDLVKFFAC
jgi:hypothetical protein